MHYEAAISLNRNYAAAIADLGYSKMLVAQPAEGAVLLERAPSMSPRDPLRAIWYSRVGQCDLYLERFETARTALETSWSLNPNLAWNHLYLAGVYALLAAFPEAQAALADAQRLYPGLKSIKSYKALSQISHPDLELLGRGPLWLACGSQGCRMRPQSSRRHTCDGRGQQEVRGPVQAKARRERCFPKRKPGRVLLPSVTFSRP